MIGPVYRFTFAGLLVLTKWERAGPGRSPPELPARETRPFRQRLQLRVGDVRIDLAEAGEGAEAAVGARDDTLAADDVGETADALGNVLGMLDEVRHRIDHAWQQDLVIRNPRLLEHRPLVAVARIRRLERDPLRLRL